MLNPVSRFLVGVVLAAAAPARAQLAVIDVPAIVQLVQQVQALQQQVQTAENQLAQAKQALQTMTGERGMQLLLRDTPRNYLPSNWPQLANSMRGTGAGLPGLSTDIQAVIAANAVLRPQQLAQLSAADQQRIVAGRETSALQQALAQAALANVSGRFAAIQALIDAIAGAADQKAILDLQARITAELGMLQNEQSKLQVLQATTRAQESLDRQREQEQAIAGQGSFANRFQPVP